MKKGCIFCLVIFAASWIGYWVYLQSTPLADKWWVPGLLALSVLLVVSNLWGISIALKQKIASGRSQADWRDGKLVGVSGVISASRPVTAPFSGKSAAIVEYEISKTSHGSNNSTQKTKECFGFMMAPTSIQSMRGTVRLVGFPMLADVRGTNVTDESAYRNAGEFLVKTTFKPEPGSALKILAEINAVLTDEDGVVDAHFGDMELRDSVLAGDYDPDDTDEITDTDDGTDENPVDEEPAEAPDAAGSAGRVGEKLSTRGYDLTETVISPGETITAFGTYRASKQAIDIGSGMTNLSHSLHRGPIEKVLFRKLRNSCFGTLFWGAVAAAGHWYVGKLVGLVP